VNHLLMDSTIQRALWFFETQVSQGVLTVEMDAESMGLALAELQRHRADTRARGALPMFVPGQPTEGEMVKALDELAAYVSAAPDDERLRASEKLLRGALREVLHLRRHVTLVQEVARRERDARMAAEKDSGTLTAEKNALMVAVVKLVNDGATSPDVAVISRTPLNAPPIEDRSPRWQEAAARIEAAEAKGADPAQADMDIVLEEHLKHLGFVP